MDRAELIAFIRRHPLAVETTTSPAGMPQAAVVGVVVSDHLEIFFDTLATSRKCANLRRDPRVALVIGWDLEEARTVQLEGAADEPTGADLARLQALYFAAFPDGVERAAQAEITYVRVRPSWARFSDFRVTPPVVVEVATR